MSYILSHQTVKASPQYSNKVAVIFIEEVMNTYLNKRKRQHFYKLLTSAGVALEGLHGAMRLLHFISYHRIIY